MGQKRLIMGIHSVEELLKAAPERLVEIFCTKSVLDRKSFIQKVEQKRIPLKVVSKDALTKKVASDSHQGVVAYIEIKPKMSLHDLLENLSDQDRSFVLILDRIYDPHNLGAILRSAECFQIDAVIWSKNRGADLTPVVAKTSSGASELVPIVKVSNLSDTVKKLQDEGFDVLAAEFSTDSQSLYDHEFASKTALVMGSEGEGIQPLLSKRVDKSLHIPMKGQIDSLNVSQATAVMLSTWSQSNWDQSN